MTCSDVFRIGEAKSILDITHVDDKRPPRSKRDLSPLTTPLHASRAGNGIVGRRHNQVKLDGPDLATDDGGNV